jgi:hypothetical protein
MPKKIQIVLFVLAMITVVVSVDILFFRNHVWGRLVANISIVLVFAAFYFIFRKKP